MKYIIGNWKSNKSLDQALDWWKQFKKEYVADPGVMAVVAVPFPYLAEVAKLKAELGLGDVKLAAQDVSSFPYGAYTGAVSAAMISEWADYAIIGHSERREYFHETDQDVSNKLQQLMDNGMGAVVCVDEPYAASQRAAIGEMNKGKVVVAYEPLAAIGTGNPEDPKEVERVVARVIKLFDGVPVIYGGSTNPENAATYLNIPGLGGLLPGGASLDAGQFGKMCETAAK